MPTSLLIHSSPIHTDVSTITTAALNGSISTSTASPSFLNSASTNTPGTGTGPVGTGDSTFPSLPSVYSGAVSQQGSAEKNEGKGKFGFVMAFVGLALLF